MNNLICTVASCVVNSIWEVSLIAGAGWVASRLLKKLDSHVEHVIWVLTLALAVLTPALPLWRWLLRFLYFPAGVKEHLSITFVAAEIVEAKVRNAALLSPALIKALLVLYVIALLYFTIRLSWSLYLTFKLRREAQPLSLQLDKAELWKHCQRVFSVKRAVVLSSSQIAGPVTIAFRESALLLPSGFSEECDRDDLRAALAHECAHIKRRDFQKNLFYEVVSLVIAFHPVTWMVKSQIAQTREMICDGMAVEKLIDSDTYTQSLLRLATMVSLSSRVAPSHAIGIFDANILEKRVMMIAKEQHLSLFVKYCLIVPAALLLFFVAAGAGRMAVAIAPQTTSQAPDQDKPHGQVYKIGKDVSAPKLISEVSAVYPESAHKEKGKFDGSCVVGMIVDASGVPHDVHITRSLGPDFDANAIKAVQQYRFNPARRAGEPVTVSVNVEVNFKKY
jgi:TonB family protein